MRPKLGKSKARMFSVVIPCFNEERYISKLLIALESQVIDADLFEIVIVDNNSTDKTAQVIWDYTLNTKLNIRMVHEYTAGVSIARNSGAVVASGEVIVFLDADNSLNQNFLFELSKYISKKNCLAGSICTLPDSSNYKGWFVFVILEIIKVISPRPFGKSFVKREVFSCSGGFNENIVLGENVEFLCKVKRIVKNMEGKFGHIRPGIKCSLRRFDQIGYMKILVPWLLAYSGDYALKYKTMVDINNR